MQERRRRLDELNRVKRQVEPVGVADDDRAVWAQLGDGRVEAEVTPNRHAGCGARREPAAADLALTCVPAPRRILDAGCGTGYLLGQLAARAPRAEALDRIDAAPAMIEVARGAAADDRLRFTVRAAERLPWPAASFDLAVSTTSFDHWAGQRAGLAQCARVLAPGGSLVLADLFSVLLMPTLMAGRPGKARTKRRATELVTAAGFEAEDLGKPGGGSYRPGGVAG